MNEPRAYNPSNTDLFQECTLKLFFMLSNRAFRVLWLLEELAVPYEVVKLDPVKQENRAPAYLAIHPLGEVPALVDGDVTLFEPLACCLHLADRFPEKQLAPPPGATERGPYYQWMVFAELAVEPAVMELYSHTKLSEEQKASAGSQEALARHRARLNDVLGVVDARLEGREVLVGGHFTAADVVMAFILHMANTQKLLEGHPRLVEYVRRHTRRPALVKAFLA